jgi:hypothetical protein
VFWEETIALQVSNLSVAVRWDIFEENLIALLLDKMNFSNDLLNKISWKTFLDIALKEIADTYPDSTEMPQAASNPKLLPPFKGLHVTKERFC